MRPNTRTGARVSRRMALFAGTAAVAVGGLTVTAPAAQASGTYLGDRYVAQVSGCKAWMNGADWTSASGGYYQQTQAMLESWGSNCRMDYVRTGPKASDGFDDERFQDGAGTLSTNFYWDGPGYRTWVCVVNLDQGTSQCGDEY